MVYTLRALHRYTSTNVVTKIKLYKLGGMRRERIILQLYKFNGGRLPIIIDDVIGAVSSAIVI